MIEVRKKIHIPIYGGWIHLVITDEDDVYEAAKRNFNTDNGSLKQVDGVVLGKSESSPRIYPLIFSGNITPGIIAHECKHVVNKLFLDIDLLLDRANDEHETYLLSWIVNRVWETKTKFEKKKKKKK